jgi:hypothetical protein
MADPTGGRELSVEGFVQSGVKKIGRDRRALQLFIVTADFPKKQMPKVAAQVLDVRILKTVFSHTATKKLNTTIEHEDKHFTITNKNNNKNTENQNFKLIDIEIKIFKVLYVIFNFNP